LRVNPHHTRPLFVLLLAVPLVAHADVSEDVPAAEDYALVYQLDLPAAGAFHQTGVEWAIDRAEDAPEFDRVAWYLALTRPDGPRQFVFVSARAHTTEARALGIPHHGAGIAFQRALSDMEVISDADGVVSGVGRRGHIEFWPDNYDGVNAAAVPGARDGLYDSGDRRVPGSYGSMQVHDVDAAATLFAYNHWGDGVVSDLGIGDNRVPDAEGVVHPDWTFRANAREWAERTLQILVRPGPTPPELKMALAAPLRWAVHQRQPGNRAAVPVRGWLDGVEADRVEARVVPVAPDDGAPGEWVAVDDTPADGFDGTLEVEAGWYALEVRAMAGDVAVADRRVEPIGVGEVFVTAGQSNSANHGEWPLTPVDVRVTAAAGEAWRPAADPQPIATGEGGSPWPALGDLLAERWDVPVGFVSVGWGGTAVGQWQPDAEEQLYTRLQLALPLVGPNGARAVLWHQGESDTAEGTPTEVYAAGLNRIIAASRRDAGWDVPWGVARVGFLPGQPAGAIDAITAAQDAVIAVDPLVFEGPQTDDLVGPAWRYDEVHFNEAGLREHARRWAERIALPPCAGFAGPDGPVCGAPDAGAGDATPSDPADPGDGVADAGVVGDASADAGGGPAGAGEQTDGAGCAAAPEPRCAPWMLLALLAAGRRRRR
jgi:hypothetical protein